MTRYPHDPDDKDDVETWVDLPPVPGLHLVADAGIGAGVDEADEPSPQECWFLAQPGTPGPPQDGGSSGGWAGVGHRLPRGAWAVLAATIAVLAGVVVVSTGGTGEPGDWVPATTAAPPSSTPVPQGPCAGLTGEVVTDRAADPVTLAGVIASFEARYYLDRDAGRAMLLLAPETGITLEGLAAGIATIPAGTRHCVAITPITPTTANVHIAEVRPDNSRVDYLQLINTRPAADTGALLISNFQKQG